MSGYVTCPFKRSAFYPMYTWRHNLVHQKYSCDFSLTKWDLLVLTSSAKSMNRVLSFVVHAQFWRVRTKEFSILVNQIFPTLLAAWSRQQYPCTWIKLSFIVQISQSDKKEEHFLPSPCTAFSQFLSVNSLRWRIRGKWAGNTFSLGPRDPKSYGRAK